MRKRVLSLFMVFALCLTLLPTSAFADEIDVQATGNEASVDGKEYATLTDAINAITSLEQTIVLLKDVTLSDNFSWRKDAAIRINMDGHSITCKDLPIITESLTLTNGTLIGDVSVRGTLNLTAPAYADAAIKGSLSVFYDGVVNISGAKAGLDGSLTLNSSLKYKTNIVISGSKQAVKNAAAAVSVPTDLGVYGSASAGDSTTRTRAVFSDGTYTVGSETAKTLVIAPKPAITLNPANATINAGETAIFNATYDGTDALTASVENGADNHITTTVTDKQITVTTTVDTPLGDYTLTVQSSDDETITRTAAIAVKEAPTVATVGGTKFSTLAGAIAAANGDTITLVDTVTESITVPSGTTAYIDLNGQTWQSGDTALDTMTINGGKVTLTTSTDSGSIVMSTAGSAVMVNSGKLEVVGPSVTLRGCTGCVALYVESNCDVTLDDGTTLYGGLATRTTIAECLNMDGKALQKCNVEAAQNPYVYLNLERTALDVEVVSHPSSHNFDKGVCYMCGYVCPHTNASANDSYCPDCKNEFIAKVTIGDKIFPHISMKAAFAAADAAQSPATVTLLKDVDIGNNSTDFAFVFNYSDVTIDLGGHALQYSCSDHALALDDADVTIKNGTIQNVGGYSGANAVRVSAGTLTLENVAFTLFGSNGSGIMVGGGSSAAKLIVAADNGDSKCVFDNAVEIGPNSTAQLSGGVYNKGILFVASYTGAKDYSALVANGYAFADKNGKVISYDTVKERMESTDDSMDKTLKVVPHTHNGSPCECGLICEHPTDKVDEDGKCTVCNHQYAFKTDAPYKGKSFFDTFYDAVDPVLYGKATTLTLLKDATCNVSNFPAKSFTLDLQNFTFSLPSQGLSCQNAIITLRGGKDSKLNGELNTPSGTVILPAGFEGYIDYINTAHAAVQSGSVGTLRTYPSDAANGNIQLYSGSFGNINVSGIWSDPISTVWGKLLAPGYRFQSTTNGSEPPKYNDELSYYHDNITNVKVVPCTYHEYDNGYCIYCHAACPHEKVTNGKCDDCGFQMPVSVTANGETAYYADLDSAFAAAQAGATVTLLDNAESGVVAADSPAFTLELNGYNVNKLTVGAQITIKDSGATRGTIGSLSVTAENVTLGDLTESGYAFKSTVSGSTWYTTGTTAQNIIVSPIPIKSMEYARSAATTYGKSCTLSVTVTPVSPGDAVAYQWYQVMDGEASEITDAQNGSYTIPNNLNVGQYTYRVAVTVDGYTQMSENINVTVQCASIEGKTVTVSKPTYTGMDQTPSALVEGLGTGDYAVSCTAQKDVGTYDVKIIGCGNYTGTIETTWEIKRATLMPSVTGTDKTYDGTDTAAMNVTFEGLQNEETLAAGVDYTVSAHYRDADAGENKTISGTIMLNDTAKARNYRLLLNQFEISGSISKTEQTISAEDITAVYGDTDKTVKVSDAIGALTYSVNDPTILTLDDTGALTILKSGDAVVTIRAAGNGNYQSAETTVKVHVAKREISVKADDKSMTVGGALPAFTATYGNFVFDETADTVLDSKPLPTTTADGKTTGTFNITVEAPTLKSDMEDKYTVGTPVSGILTVNPRTSSGGGGSSTSTPTYKPSVTPSDGGTTTVSNPNPKKGDTVTITPKPDNGNEVSKVIVTDKSGNTVAVKENADGTYSFTQPDGAVKIEVIYQEKPSEPTQSAFTDVSENHFAYNAVKWAQDKGITEGIGNGQFGVKQACTRGQIVTFLWRAAGSPEPQTMPNLSDISLNAYYAKAVAWAVEQGITTGTSDTTFSPDNTCTRAQAVTFLARALNATPNGTASFADVPTDAYYANAVAWAAANGITAGMGDGLFAPNSHCTRAQIVTFLYRAYQ